MNVTGIIIGILDLRYDRLMPFGCSLANSQDVCLSLDFGELDRRKLHEIDRRGGKIRVIEQMTRTRPRRLDVRLVW